MSPADRKKLTPSRVLLWLLVAAALIWVFSPGFFILGFPFGHHGCSSLPDLDLQFFPSFLWGFAGFGWILHLLLAVWVYVDAQSSGQNGFLWALLVFFTSIVGLLVYLIAGAQIEDHVSRQTRASAPPPVPPPAPEAPGAVPSAETRRCPGCRAAVEPGFIVCPMCGRSLNVECVACGARLEPEWKVCPHCATTVE